MRLPRELTLLAGTVGVIGVCYAIAAPRREKSAPQVVRTPARSFHATDDVEQRCRLAADQLRRDGSPGHAWLVRSPYVLTGDLAAEQLDELYREIIVPTTRALEIDYFDQSPGEPIVIVALSTDESYRTALQRIGQSRRAEYSGLYQRDQRTIWLNLSTGMGTLAHELTHALAHADFPDLPEWFDEGLASLHEEAEFSPDGWHLVGQDNWRRRFLDEALDRQSWKPLSRLLAEPFACTDVAALDYALARYVCLYLQERGLLPAFYRKCRSRIASDRTGQSALLSLFPGQSIEDIDSNFREWLTTREDWGSP